MFMQNEALTVHFDYQSLELSNSLMRKIAAIRLCQTHFYVGAMQSRSGLSFTFIVLIE